MTALARSSEARAPLNGMRSSSRKEPMTDLHRLAGAVVAQFEFERRRTDHENKSLKEPNDSQTIEDPDFTEEDLLSTAAFPSSRQLDRGILRMVSPLVLFLDHESTRMRQALSLHFEVTLDVDQACKILRVDAADFKRCTTTLHEVYCLARQASSDLVVLSAGLELQKDSVDPSSPSFWSKPKAPSVLGADQDTQSVLDEVVSLRGKLIRSLLEFDQLSLQEIFGLKRTQIELEHGGIKRSEGDDFILSSRSLGLLGQYVAAVQENGLEVFWKLSQERLFFGRSGVPLGEGCELRDQSPNWFEEVLPATKRPVGKKSSSLRQHDLPEPATHAQLPMKRSNLLPQNKPRVLTERAPEQEKVVSCQVASEAVQSLLTLRGMYLPRENATEGHSQQTAETLQSLRELLSRVTWKVDTQGGAQAEVLAKLRTALPYEMGLVSFRLTSPDRYAEEYFVQVLKLVGKL